VLLTAHKVRRAENACQAGGPIIIKTEYAPHGVARFYCGRMAQPITPAELVTGASLIAHQLFTFGLQGAALACAVLNQHISAKTEEETKARGHGSKRKQKEQKRPRAVTGFNLFIGQTTKELRESQEQGASQAELMKEAAQMWSSLEDSEKEQWKAKAGAETVKRQAEWDSQHPQSDENEGKRRRQDKKKRAPSAWNLYRKAIQPELSGSFTEQGQQAIAKWKSLSPEEKEEWQEKAQTIKQQLAADSESEPASSQGKSTKTQKKKRSPSGWNLFRRSVQPELTGTFAEKNQQAIAKWKSLTDAEKQLWQEKARQLKEQEEQEQEDEEEEESTD